MNTANKLRVPVYLIGILAASAINAVCVLGVVANLRANNTQS